MNASTPPTQADFAERWVNLAQPRLGAQVIFATDEFFADKSRLIHPEPAVFIHGKYDDNGKWMDGWETRRWRATGHNHCIVKLGRPGLIKGVDIDTSHFTGNFPAAASIDACHSETDPDNPTQWTEIVPALSLKGNTHHFVAVADERIWTHLKLHIYPDGGVARLRVYGVVQVDWEKRDRQALYDLIALDNGGRAIACNDKHFGMPENLLAPGRALNMGDGWETRRRREPGNDWTIIALGHAGVAKRVEVDTLHFKGNYPESCSIQAAAVHGGTEQALPPQSMFWETLLPNQRLQMNHLHVFEQEVLDIGAITHIRFNIFPDGGVSRLRLFGHIA